MKIFTSMFFGICLPVFVASAQNLADWSRQYDCQNNHDCFNDIFATVDRGYITCGMSEDRIWLTKMDGNGGIQWSRLYGEDGNNYDAVWTIIEVDGGGYLIGMERNYNLSALRVDSRGEVIWWNDYNAGICHALIELKGGNFILVGHGDGRADRAGRLIMINDEGELIWDKLYDPGYCDLYSLKESNGGIVTTGSIAESFVGYHGTLNTCLVKFDFNGDVVWERTLAPMNSSIGRGIVAAHGGGYALTGYCSYNDYIMDGGYMYLIKTNDIGEMSWWRALPLENDEAFELGWSISAPLSGGYAIVGTSEQIMNNGNNYLKMVRTTDMGVVTWKRLFGRGVFYGGESKCQMFYSVIRGHDNSILAAGNILNGEEEGLNGFIIKLEPRELEPMRITYEPRDTTLTILPETPQRFTVHVQGEPEGPLSFLWTLDNAEISSDTTTVIQLDAPGDYEVCCFVADERRTGSVKWRVTVDELFIVGSSPEGDSLRLHRSAVQSFSIDSVASHFQADELDYYWTLVRSDGTVLSEFRRTDIVSVEFNRVGQYIVTGIVGREGQSDQVSWRVNVEGLIWSNEPEPQRLSVRPDTPVSFRIIPLISDPSNVYSWYLDDEFKAGGDDSIFVTQFHDKRQYCLVGFLSHHSEADSVIWDIQVGDQTYVENDRKSLPLKSEMFTASPNPFNSTVTIRHAVGLKTDATRLTIYDISGREVAKFALPPTPPASGEGESSVVWDAAAFPAGIYFARLEAGGQVSTVKMVLVR